jgi:DNA-binding response OmpR family regulator
MPERILVIEDDPIFSCVVRDNLVYDGYQVDTVATASAALSRVRAFAPDLILLDLTLPDGDGLKICPQLRGVGKVPIIILSARGQKLDKIRGLKLGADDYITKPIDFDELLARIRAVLRRAHPTVSLVLVGRLLIDFRRQRATCGTMQVRLTHREFELLRYLAERRDRVVHRDELLREVWGYLDSTVMTRAVDQTIARLRKKIEPDPHHPEFLRTAHRDGYCLNVEDRS